MILELVYVASILLFVALWDLGLSYAKGIYDSILNLRRRFPVNGSCWFCNATQKLHYDERNSWTCTSCTQYNGFLPDGGYNCKIPAQSEELLNRSFYCANRQKLKDLKTNNGLCVACARNQRLKIEQLSFFSPKDEENFDQEIQEYAKMLEEAYKLCAKCVKIVQKAISDANESVMTGKFALIRSQGLNMNQGKSLIVIAFSRLMVSVLSFIYLATLLFKFNHNNSQICKLFPNYTSGNASVFSLFPNIMGDWFETSSIFGLCVEYLCENNTLVAFTQLILSVALLFSRVLDFTSLFFWQSILWLLSLVLCYNNQELFQVIDPMNVAYDLKISLSVILLLMSLQSLNEPIVPRCIENESLTPEKKNGPAIHSDSFRKPKSSFAKKNQEDHTGRLFNSIAAYEESLEALMRFELNLYENELTPPPSISSTCIFKKRMYHTKVPNEFKQQPVCDKHSIIAPAKFKPSSSWVVESYWSQSSKHMVNMTTFASLSRASSQSSEIESFCSNCSFHNSVHLSRRSSSDEGFGNLSGLSESNTPQKGMSRSGSFLVQDTGHGNRLIMFNNEQRKLNNLKLE